MLCVRPQILASQRISNHAIANSNIPPSYSTRFHKSFSIVSRATANPLNFKNHYATVDFCFLFLLRCNFPEKFNRTNNESLESDRSSSKNLLEFVQKLKSRGSKLYTNLSKLFLEKKKKKKRFGLKFSPKRVNPWSRST